MFEIFMIFQWCYLCFLSPYLVTRNFILDSLHLDKEQQNMSVILVYQVKQMQFSKSHSINAKSRLSWQSLNRFMFPQDQDVQSLRKMLRGVRNSCKTIFNCLHKLVCSALTRVGVGGAWPCGSVIRSQMQRLWVQIHRSALLGKCLYQFLELTQAV